MGGDASDEAKKPEESSRDSALVRASQALRARLDAGTVMQLATLDEAGAPAVSLVPYVLAWSPLRIYAFVSDLAAHTSALRRDPRCAILVHALPSAELASDPREHHAVERVSLRASATLMTREQAREASVEELYRARFPAMAGMLLGLKDFHFVRFEPLGASFVQGFGRAYSAAGDDLERLEHVTGR